MKCLQKWWKHECSCVCVCSVQVLMHALICIEKPAKAQPVLPVKRDVYFTHSSSLLLQRTAQSRAAPKGHCLHVMVLCHYQMAPCHDAAESLLHNGRNSTLYKYSWTEAEYDPEIQKHCLLVCLNEPSIKTKFKALIKKRPDLMSSALVSSTGRLKQQLLG